MMGPAAWARHPSPYTLLLRTSASLSLTPATRTGSNRLDSRPATPRPPDTPTRACRISPIVPTEKDLSATVHVDFFWGKKEDNTDESPQAWHVGLSLEFQMFVPLWHSVNKKLYWCKEPDGYTTCSCFYQGDHIFKQISHFLYFSN